MSVLTLEAEDLREVEADRLIELFIGAGLRLRGRVASA